jgi:uncharacterized protein YbjT (DUF2867 family)
MEPILVTGGTGTLGRAVVTGLRAAGVPVRVLSRRPGPDHVVADLTEGPPSLSDVDTVIHLASTLRGKPDVVATQNLLTAAADVRHLVFMSIVGVDRIPIGYYKGKLAAEQLMSRLPHTILRATQFHDLIHRILSLAAKLPVMPVPALRAQPVDVRDVAARLVDLAQGPPQGRVPDFGGPDVRTLPELAAEYLKASGRRRKVLPMRFPGKAFRAYHEGGNLVPPGNPAGTITFADYLGES